MEPYDIHDPTMSPTAPPERADQIEGSGFGAGFTGHFEMTAGVTGTLTLAGRTFDVDCVDTMDHSWGPRTERGMRSVCWGGGHFGEDYAWHGLIAKDPFAAPEDEFRLAHGYILEDGKVIGLTGGTMVVRRENGIAGRGRHRPRRPGRPGAPHDRPGVGQPRLGAPRLPQRPRRVLRVHGGRARPPGYGVIEEALPST